MKLLIVGAGFSGTVLANKLSNYFEKILIIDKRNHIGGNCYTYEESDIIIHKYGPHIFHTDKKKIWDYVNKFTEFEKCIYNPYAKHQNKIYSLPINLHTINQYFGKSFSPLEAEKFIKSKTLDIQNPKNFEEQALSMIGSDLYYAFFYGYTKKQWGKDPKEIPSSVLKRLPLRFNYNNNYFFHPYQGMPVNGYTPIFEQLTSKKNIEVKLNCPFLNILSQNYDHVIYTGPIDEYFNYKFGELEYRSIEFEKEYHDINDYQGSAVINYSDFEIPYTRITEHKHFHSKSLKNKNNTIIFKEFSKKSSRNDEKYYPVKLVNDKNLLKKYVEYANSLNNISFAGRLGTFSYLDMDKCIDKAIDLSDRIILNLQKNEKITVF